MKISKLLAGMSAAAIVASMLSMVSISADNEKTETTVDSIKYSFTVKTVDKATSISFNPSADGMADSVGSVDVDKAGDYSVTVSDINATAGLQNLGFFEATDDAKVELTVTSVTVNNDYTIEVNKDLNNLEKYQNGLENKWGSYDGDTKLYSSDKAEIDFVKDGGVFKFFTLKDNSATEEALSASATWNGAEGGTATDYSISAWDGTWIQTPSKEGYTADTTDAKIKLTFTLDDSVDVNAADFADQFAFVYGNTNKKDHAVKTVAGQKVYTVEVAATEYMTYDGIQTNPDGSFGGNFQAGNFTGKLTASVTGVKYNVVDAGEALSASATWNGADGGATTDYAMTAWDGTWIQTPSKEGNTADTTNAKIKLTFTLDDSVDVNAADFADQFAFVYGNTNKKDHAVKTVAGQKEYTVEVSAAEYMTYDGIQKNEDGSFGGNFQAGNFAGKLTAAVYGVVYVPAATTTTTAATTAPEKSTIDSKTFLMYADGQWSWKNMGLYGVADKDGNYGRGEDTEITKDGTYTVSVSKDNLSYFYGDNKDLAATPETDGATKADLGNGKGATVFCVDMVDLANQIGAGTDGLKLKTAADKQAVAESKGVKITNVKVLVDGKEFYTPKESEYYFGDIEGNGNLRLELYNEYGDTKEVAGLKDIYSKLDATDNIEVTFDIAGLPKDAVTTTTTKKTTTKATTTTAKKATTKTTTTTKANGGNKNNGGNNTNTGFAASFATLGAALAAAAAIVTKKRK